MKYLVLFAFITIAMVTVSGIPLNSRVIGGSQIDIAAYPFHVAILYETEYYMCTGSIIASQWVITAAHCTFEIDLAFLSVRAGSSNKYSGGEIFNVAESITHPDYNIASQSDLDVALLRFDATLSGLNMATISISSASPTTGQQLSVSGWGAIEMGEPSSDFLHAVAVNVMDIATCRQMYSQLGEDANLVSDNKFCSLGAASDSGTCYGDGGGPLIDGNGLIVGVVSGGMGCGISNIPDLNTNLAIPAVREFITQHAGV